MRMIYPGSMLRSSSVDEYFEEEFSSFDNPAIYSFEDGKVFEKGQSLDGETLLYRGWIVSLEDYEKLNKSVENKGGKLLISPEKYFRSQFAQGWINVFEEHTPETKIYHYDVDSNTMMDDFANSAESFVVKGSSKSLKHDWDNSMFAPSFKDIVRVVNNFKEQVSESEESHILIREFEKLAENELRVFWVDNVATITDHPNNAETVVIDERIEKYVDSLMPLIKSLDAGFVSTDIVDSDKGLRVVEVGSGMVSGSSVPIFNIVHKLFDN